MSQRIADSKKFQSDSMAKSTAEMLNPEKADMMARVWHPTAAVSWEAEARFLGESFDDEVGEAMLLIAVDLRLKSICSGRLACMLRGILRWSMMRLRARRLEARLVSG